MTKSNLFKKAHKIAKTLEGNYTARMSYSLKFIWSEIKGKKMVELTGTEKQIKWANDIIKEAMNVVKFLELALNNQDADKKEKYKIGVENMKNEFNTMTKASEIIEKYSKYTTRSHKNFEFAIEDFKVKGRLAMKAVELLHAS